MPLSDDQKALLRLLAQREEAYEDISALLGIGIEELRTRVRAALAELDTASVDAAAPAPAAPSPAPARNAEPAAAPEPAPPAPAARRVPASTRKAARHPGLRRSGVPTPHWPPRLPESPARRRLLALAAGVLGVVAAVLIGMALLGGDADTGSSGSGAAQTGASAPTAAKTGAGNGGKLTQAVLEPVDGSEAKGRAILGKLEDEVVLEVLAKGLSPSAPGESYAIWLYHDPKLALRIGAVKVGKSGGLAVRLPIPTELLAYIASGAFGQIYVSSTAEAAYKAEVAKAKAESRLPAYTGTTVLRGAIVGPALRQARSEG